MSDHDDQPLVSAIQRHLDVSTDAMDARTQIRLRQARRRALMSPAHRPLPGWRPLAVTALLALLTVGLWQHLEETPPRSSTDRVQLAEMEPDIMLDPTEPPGDEEQSEFLADVEFYAWLGSLPSAQQTTHN